VIWDGGFMLTKIIQCAASEGKQVNAFETAWNAEKAPAAWGQRAKR
jgi:hypothetical protein